jgi:hypothetical protein
MWQELEARFKESVSKKVIKEVERVKGASISDVILEQVFLFFHGN